MRARLAAIDYVLPDTVVSNEQLTAEYQGWSVDKIEGKTGIRERHIAGPDECASDLAERAARKLFERGACQPGEIDHLILCTQAPDYFLPTTACLLQSRLGLPTRCGAFDFNLGCSGYVYGLALAKGLIETGQAQKLLLLTAETYSKFIHAGDKSVRTLFGDAAAATLLTAVDAPEERIGHFVFGTDGAGGKNLIVPTGGMRARAVADAPAVADDQGNRRTVNNLFMNGPEIFTFTLRIVPETVQEVLRRSARSIEEIDLFVFHQANRYMLEHLRKKLGVPPEKFWNSMANCGNTVSSTIPIALKQAEAEGRLRPGTTVMVLGFGVGYSWAGALLRWG